jgi:hypothetical protein
MHVNLSFTHIAFVEGFVNLVFLVVGVLFLADVSEVVGNAAE